MVAYTVDERMKHESLRFATSLAWTLVLLGATVFAIFVRKLGAASVGGLFRYSPLAVQSFKQAS
jgi:hypothetical protein